MTYRPLAALALVAIATTTVAMASAGTSPWRVSAQGRVAPDLARYHDVSPLGTTSVDVVPRRVDFHLRSADVTVTGPDGIPHVMLDLDGATFLPAEDGLLVAIDPFPAQARIRVLDLTGRERLVRRVPSLSDPALTSDGHHLVYRRRGGVSVLDLARGTVTDHAPSVLFAAGPSGRFAGVVADAPRTVMIDDGATTFTLAVDVRKLAWSSDGAQLWVLDARTLSLYTPAEGKVAPVLACPAGAEFRDLRLGSREMAVGLRHIDGTIAHGTLIVLDTAGRVRARRNGPSADITPAAFGENTHETIPWPLLPNAQHAVGNTYGEYQNYGSAYLHPGFDIFGSPGQAVYAVKGGVVKAILTTSGAYHWRIAIGEPGSGTSEGYLYAHVDQPTIAVSVGQTVTTGQFLGNLVEWPNDNFTHCHFGRIRDAGTVWSGSWLNTDNPHLDMENQNDQSWPVFVPAVGNDMFAFCTNQTSSYQSPAALHGAIDIIAHVGDTINSSWVCAVQSIRYSIYPAGHPEQPVVDDKLAVNFDMLLDTYQNSTIDQFLVGLLYKRDTTCFTEGDYGAREFYHIITNSNGDEIYDASDLAEAWDTTQLYDGDYVVDVTARDASGRAASATMTVTTQNGNFPTGVGEDLAPSLTLRGFPNPTPAGVNLRYALPRAGATTLAVYDLGGRLVRHLVGGLAVPGAYATRWDGRNDAGVPVAGGTYLLKLTSTAGVRTEKVLLVR